MAFTISAKGKWSGGLMLKAGSIATAQVATQLLDTVMLQGSLPRRALEAGHGKEEQQRWGHC